MIDDLVELAVVAAIDVEVDKAAKKHRWVRVLRATIGLLFLYAIVALIYLTVKYS